MIEPLSLGHIVNVDGAGSEPFGCQLVDAHSPALVSMGDALR